MLRMLIVLVFVGLCVHTASALDGSGTQEDPYQIQSLADFDEFASDPNYWSGFTRLETDVNLAGRTYTVAVIAPDMDSSTDWHQGTKFTGVFDGNAHKITNLTIDDGGVGNDFLGLFGCIGEDGEVRNLGVETGSVSGDSLVGGLVGLNVGSVSNCYSKGYVSGDYDVGGLVGYNSYYGMITNCYSTSSVTGYEYVGGLVGQNGIFYCFKGQCYGYPGYIYNNYSTGDVNGIDCIGGLVGINVGTVSNCYSTGDISGDYNVGGTVGHNGFFGWTLRPAYISNSYSSGIVQGSSNVGGLVGYNEVGTIDRSFWDVQTSGEPNMCGAEYWSTDCDPNCGKTTAEMKTRSTFTDAGWDFVDVWLMNEGATYPVLRQEIRSDLNGIAGVDFLDFAIFADHWLEGTGE